MLREADSRKAIIACARILSIKGGLIMNVFISYSSESLKQAEKLREALQAHGISVWVDTEGSNSGSRWQQRIEQAIHDADAIVALIDSPTARDEFQRRTWQAALEAVWSDSGKRLIPFLLRDVEPPAFVRSMATDPEEKVVAIRARDLRRDWNGAVEDLVAVLRNEPAPGAHVEIVTVTERDRAEQKARLDYIVEVARMRAERSLPAEPGG
jgi:hypothetical protein